MDSIVLTIGDYLIWPIITISTYTPNHIFFRVSAQFVKVSQITKIMTLHNDITLPPQSRANIELDMVVKCLLTSIFQMIINFNKKQLTFHQTFLPMYILMKNKQYLIRCVPTRFPNQIPEHFKKCTRALINILMLIILRRRNLIYMLIFLYLFVFILVGILLP